MRKVRTVLASLATLALATGTAVAGDPKAAPAPKADATKTAQTTPAPAKTPTPAPAAKPTPAPAPAAKTAPAPAAKPAGAAAAATGAAAEPKPGAEPPKPAPAPELAAAAKAHVGTWRCKGTVYGPDGAARPSSAIIRTKVDLDKFWLMSSMQETTGKNKYKFVSYRTFDPAAKKWSSVMVDNWGGHQVATSVDGVNWEGTSNSPMGTMKTKDTETVVSRRELKLVGQYSTDGKTWVNGYDVTCKK